MIALRLVHLIESHSEQLAESLLRKVERSSRTTDLRKVPAKEIRERAREVYRNLSNWLLNKTEDDIERVYRPLGRRRAEQGVALSALSWALMMYGRKPVGFSGNGRHAGRTAGNPGRM